jgi:hypothetical protein
MNISRWLLVLLLLLTGGLALADRPGDQDEGHGNGDEEQVTICHIPPGNPSNQHTITVGASAVAAHAAHGDKVTGGCASAPPPPSPGPNGVLTICSSKGNSNGHQLTVSSIGRVSHIKISCN